MAGVDAPPNRLRRRGPLLQPNDRAKFIFLLIFYYFKLLTHQYFFYDTPYTIQARRVPQRKHPTAGDTSGEGARRKESSTLLLELPIRSDGSVPQGRIPPALVAEAVGETAAQDLTMFIEVDDDTHAQAPCNRAA